MSLALLGEHPEAIDALAKAVIPVGMRSYDLVIMSYAPPDAVRAQVHTLAQWLFKSGRPYGAGMLLELMGVVGDESTVKLLRKTAQDQQELNADIKKGLLHHAGRLEQALAMEPAKRAERFKNELIFWQMSHDLRGSVNMASDYPVAAWRLAEDGLKLAANLLIAKLPDPGFNADGRFSDRYPSAALMAIAVLGQQKKAAAVSEIARFAPGKHIFGEVAVGALRQIGTPEAMRILNSLPAGDNP